MERRVALLTGPWYLVPGHFLRGRGTQSGPGVEVPPSWEIHLLHFQAGGFSCILPECAMSMCGKLSTKSQLKLFQLEEVNHVEKGTTVFSHWCVDGGFDPT